MKPITIIGGGLAGLTLGIALRQNGVPVTIHEAGRYPRHRVCGEFISGDGPAVLDRLGLLDALRQKSRVAETVSFCSGRRKTPVKILPTPALCVSRYFLDDWLARVFRQEGGDLRENDRQQGFDPREGLVRATGRRVHNQVQGWRWLGLKAHARGVRLEADLEMHFSSSGYLGICRLDDEKVDVCGIFRSRAPIHGLPRHWPELLRGPENGFLHLRLRDAVFLPETFCSVAGLSVQGRCRLAAGECVIGDTLGMIAPVTGNGMSMAFESAELAAPALTAYSRGETNWGEVCERLRREVSSKFRLRLAAAAVLQWGLFQPVVRCLLIGLAQRGNSFFQTCFSWTR